MVGDRLARRTLLELLEQVGLDVLGLDLVDPLAEVRPELAAQVAAVVLDRRALALQKRDLRRPFLRWSYPDSNRRPPGRDAGMQSCLRGSVFGSRERSVTRWVLPRGSTKGRGSSGITVDSGTSEGVVPIHGLSA